MFINSADKLFSLITTIWCSGLTKHIPWRALAFGSSDWDHLEDTHVIISVCSFV
jgi:hypothetical protein